MSMKFQLQTAQTIDKQNRSFSLMDKQTEKRGFLRISWTKNARFSKKLRFFSSISHFFGNYRQKNNRSILGYMKMVKTNIHFGRNLHPFFIFYRCKFENFQSKVRLELDLSIYFFLKKSMDKWIDMDK